MRKVAVLGGGMAGLATAWALSDAVGREQVEVTVYQRGWRLGGKGASSRGVHGRIEEHGLHVWLGYYDNSFRLLQEVYAELDRTNSDPNCPIRAWRDAVAPSDHVGLGDDSDGSWSHWIAKFGRNDETPGAGQEGAAPLSVARFVQRGLGLLVDFAASLGTEPARPSNADIVLSGSPHHPRVHTTGTSSLTELLRQAEVAMIVALAEAVRMLGEAAASTPSRLSSLLVEVLGQVRTEIGMLLRRDDATRRTAELADLVVTCIQGTVRDGLLASPQGFATIDHLDLRDWLSRHGATPETLRSPLIRGLYDLVFAYEQGDPNRPRFSAGLGLLLAGKLFFDYRGAIFWQLQAGMGDVVFAPLYQALRARGVRFAFFHRVDQLHLDDSGIGVAAISLARQARTLQDRDYDPLVRVDALPCFPAYPKAEQLTGPPPIDPESHWSDRAVEEPLRLVRGRDFDEVVLATSLGMLPHVCSELLDRSPRWRTMVDGIATVPTQALQLWLRADEIELGWLYAGSTVSGYRPPFDTYASMSHLLAREDWPVAERPRTIAYFCGALSVSVQDDPATAHEAVRSNAILFLERKVGHLWPGAMTSQGGFRWSLLCGRQTAADPSALDSQYWKANVDPSDRYIQSLPGSGALRLRADQSGYENLFLAGDWIDSGLNAGCIEAAVMAGIQAANGVRRRPLSDGVLGAWFTEART